ncbi:MAG: cytochrome c biogenesis protein CcsA [Candidatus Omnitrophica bacterium]|nr:cytochrome c biogenesis protein CcsA [Candidatus Omnitrophota bacterium]
MRKVKQILFYFLMIFFVSITSWSADQVCPIAKGVSSLKEFQHILILDHGRVKPLDTYARSILVQFSGRGTFNKKPAINWLTMVLFDPGRARENQIFLINNPQIVESLGIEPDKHRRYTFSQLEEKFETLQRLAHAASEIDSKERDIVEAELIRVYENIKLYSNLSISFAFVLSHPDFTVTDAELKNMMGLGERADVFSYLDIALNADVLQKLTVPLQRLDQSKWSSQQQEVVVLAANLLKWSMIYKGMPLQIIPSYTKGDENWYSPWDIMTTGLRDASGRKELISFQKMMVDYWDGRGLDFDLNVKAYRGLLKARSDDSYDKRIGLANLELLYNQSNLFLLAKIIYLLTFIIFIFGLIFSNRWVYRTAWIFLWIGFLCHLIGLMMRITILQRPPVSNLFETFIFVGLISVIVGLIIERMTKNWLGIAVAAISGYIFLSISEKFAAEGDTMQMLVAVLNSNFWLSTHVTSITIGYAGTCVAGIVGHVYMLQAIFKSKDKELLRSTYNVLIGTLGFGLTFAFLGTNLGGIWADQSWGRFWGWDPKENGALMIILWTAMLFHAKIAKIIGPLGLAVGSILGIIVVMWAWFGVNLLSIGLHSYGFTSGLATNLLIYLLAQLLFLTVAYPAAKKRLKV